MAIVDQTSEESMEDEQNLLDCNDDDVTDLTVHIRQLASPLSDIDSRRVPSKRLAHVHKMLTTVNTGLTSLPSGANSVVLLHQFEEQLSESNSKLS